MLRDDIILGTFFGLHYKGQNHMEKLNYKYESALKASTTLKTLSRCTNKNMQQVAKLIDTALAFCTNVKNMYPVMQSVLTSVSSAISL